MSRMALFGQLNWPRMQTSEKKRNIDESDDLCGDIFVGSSADTHTHTQHTHTHTYTHTHLRAQRTPPY